MTLLVTPHAERHTEIDVRFEHVENSLNGFKSLIIVTMVLTALSSAINPFAASEWLVAAGRFHGVGV
jgi:hypothetical protein